MAKAAITLNLNSKIYLSAFFFRECELRKSTGLVSLRLECLTQLRITEKPCDVRCVKPLDSRGLWDSTAIEYRLCGH